MISQSSFFMIQIDRFYKMCMPLSLFLEPSNFSYLISYTNDMIIVLNELHIIIHPSCAPHCECVPCTIFWVFYHWQADMVHGFQQWQDRCWHVVIWAPNMSTTDDAWHTDTFSCWHCQRARYSPGSAQNCPGPTGLHRSVCALDAKESYRWCKAHCMGAYGPFLYPFNMLHW